jgi:hypothetical protein
MAEKSYGSGDRNLWDIRYDSKVKDWVFDARRDLSESGGMQVVYQRVMTRLIIRRGSFIYDEDGDLGSRLMDLVSTSKRDVLRDLEIMVQEALAPMDDVTVTNVRATESRVEGKVQVFLDIVVKPSTFSTESVDTTRPGTLSFLFPF